MLGKRTRLKWADFDRGEARSVWNWLYFSSSTTENKTQVCRTIWCGSIMYAEINRVFKMYSFQPSQSGLFWYGMFSSLHVLLGVMGYKNSHELSLFRGFVFWTASFDHYGRRSCISREYVACSYIVEKR